MRPTRPILSKGTKDATPMGAREATHRAQAAQTEATDTRDNEKPKGFQVPEVFANPRG